MSEEILTFCNGEEKIPVTVVEHLCYCHDTNSWRDLVVLATQGGRKTTASRIGKRDGRLWNLPFPPGMSVARFADGEPAIFARPENEFNLVNCTRLQMYRKYLAPNGNGVTFDLTRGKDLICSLPYRYLGDVEWNFLVAFKKDNEKSVQWFMSKEIFRLSQDGGLQKSVKARPREIQQLPPMEERECGDGAEMQQSFTEYGAPASPGTEDNESTFGAPVPETRESRAPSFNSLCAAIQQHQQHPHHIIQSTEHEAILHDLMAAEASALLVQGAIVRCRIDGSEAHGHIISVSPWDAVVDFNGARSIVARADICSVMGPTGDMIDLRPQHHHESSASGAGAMEDLSFQLPEVVSLVDPALGVPFSFGDFNPSPLAPGWINGLSFEGLASAEFQDPAAAAARFGGGVMDASLRVKQEPTDAFSLGQNAFFSDLSFPTHMGAADPILPSMFVGAHEGGFDPSLAHFDGFFTRADGL